MRGRPRRRDAGKTRDHKVRDAADSRVSLEAATADAEQLIASAHHEAARIRAAAQRDVANARAEVVALEGRLAELDAQFARVRDLFVAGGVFDFLER